MSQRDDTTSSAPAVDWKVARRRLPGGTAGIRELAAMVREDARERARGIRRAVESADATELEFNAHKLRGNAVYFAAAPVIEAATRLMHLAQQGRLAEATPLLPRLEEEVRRLCEELGRVDERLDEEGGR